MTFKTAIKNRLLPLPAPVQAADGPKPAGIHLAGNLSMSEFFAWANIGETTAYAEAKSGRLIISKVGSKSIVTAPNAVAWRDSLPAKAI